VAETIFLASGIISSVRHGEVLNALAEFGLSAYVVPPEHQLEDREQAILPYTPFEEITSTEQYLGKEHLHQFINKYVPRANKRTATKAFSMLVEPRFKAKPGHGIGMRVPAEVTGLKYKTRDELNFPKIPSEYNSDTLDEDVLNTVVQVGSTLNFIQMIVREHRLKELKHLKMPGEKVAEVLIGLNARLREQIA